MYSIPMSDQAIKVQKKYWQTAPELPLNVFKAWCKPNRALNPIALVATIDPDGAPRTALFGSLRAVTPRLLRLCSWHGHHTYANLCRDGRVMVVLITPPDVVVSVKGHARVAKEKMDTDEHYAVVEIDVENVKNDMVRRIQIESTITVSVHPEYQEWFEESLGELEDMTV
jgi:hypothetical protein